MPRQTIPQANVPKSAPARSFTSRRSRTAAFQLLATGLLFWLGVRTLFVSSGQNSGITRPAAWCLLLLSVAILILSGCAFLKQARVKSCPALGSFRGGLPWRAAVKRQAWLALQGLTYALAVYLTVLVLCPPRTAPGWFAVAMAIGYFGYVSWQSRALWDWTPERFKLPTVARPALGKSSLFTEQLPGVASKAAAAKTGRMAAWHRYFLTGAAAFLFATAGMELSLRCHDWWTGNDWRVRAHVAKNKLPPGLPIEGTRVNRQGYWDAEFVRQAEPGVRRIAVMGDATLLSGDTETNCLNQLERLLPETEVCNFALPKTGPREYAALFWQEVRQVSPDLVLVCVNAADDITAEAPLPGLFDLQSLRLVNLTTVCWSATGALQEPRQALESCSPIAPDCGYEAFLDQAATRLAVCRDPMPDELRRRWETSLGHLTALAAAAQECGVPLALVIVPADYQVDASLRRRICNRQGLTSEQLDPELPQRRLAAFASQQGMPCLDLLPGLRECSDCIFMRNSQTWNASGQTVVAHALADWLETQLPPNSSTMTQTAAR